MDTIYNNIIIAGEDLEEVFDGLADYVKEYYALFIATMAYWNVLRLDANFAAKLHMIILNSTMDKTDLLIENIENYLINRAIDDLEKELNETESTEN